MKTGQSKKAVQLKVSTQLRAGYNLNQLQGKVQKLALKIGDTAQSQLGEVTLLGSDII